MKNLLERMSSIPGFEYKSEMKPVDLVVVKFPRCFTSSFGDCATMFNAYSEKSRKIADSSLMNRLFGKNRSSEVKDMFKRMGFDPMVTREQVEIKLTLLGL